MPQRHNIFGFESRGQRVKALCLSTGSWCRRVGARVGRGVVHLWDHFIPNERNNHRPHALQHRVLAGYSAFLILLKVLVIVTPIVLPSSSLYSSAITQQNIVELTNQTRDNLGLNKLSSNELLASAAQAKADDMLVNQYFAHTSPDGRTPWSWIAQVGYRYAYAGENLAVHFTSAESLQQGWMASPSHRANIVHPKYQEIGIGIARGKFEGFETTVVVEMFGSPSTVVASAIKTPIPSEPQPVVVAPTEPAVSGETVSPVVKPAPAPAPQPVAAQPEPPKPIAVTPAEAVEQAVVEPSAITPVVYDTSLRALQVQGGYDVRLMVTNAVSVVARFAGEVVPLVADSALPPHGTERGAAWKGIVPFDEKLLSQGGDLLSITATSRDGTTVDKPLAWLAPSVSTQQLYTFNEGGDKFAKFFGFITVHNLNDTVRQFYLYFVVFLAAALLLNILIKVKVQHMSIISHTMVVAALALLLSIV